jgi:nucleoside-diphosphate-sugar epimerase
VGEAINLGSGSMHTVVEMADLVNELTSNKNGINFVERRNWDVKKQLLSSIEKAKSILGYSPSVGFEDGLGRVHDWFSANWKDIQRDAEFR